MICAQLPQVSHVYLTRLAGPHHAVGGISGDNRLAGSLIDKFNGLFLPGGGRAVSVYCPDADGMTAAAGVPARGNVVPAPFQPDRIAVRVTGRSGDIGKEVIAAGLPGYAGGEAGDNRSVVDKFNRPALPGGGRAPLIHSTDADGVCTNLIIAVLLTMKFLIWYSTGS